MESHGLPDGWVDTGGQVLLKGGDVSFLNNGDRLPIILSFSCFTGRFNDPAQPCLGELFVNAAGRGAAAFIGSTLDEDLHDNLRINGNMIEILMNSQGIDIGTAFMALKLNGQMSNMGYNLLGDPAMSFAQKPVVSRLPDLAVAAISINGNEHYVSSVSATIKNLGLTTAYGISVALFNGDPAQGGRPVSSSIKIGRLSASDNEVKIAFNLGNMYCETFEPYILIDPAHSIDETTRENNIDHCPSVRLLPDLYVSDHAGSEIPANISVAWNTCIDGRIKILTNVENRSNVTAREITVIFFNGARESGGVQLGSAAIIDSIPGNSVKTAAISITPIQEDEFSIAVSIDPNNVIEEANESNNNSIAYFRNNAFQFVETDIPPNQSELYADLNKDGWTDVIWKQYSEEMIGFSENQGDFKFQETGPRFSCDVFDNVVFIFDFNNDGFLDILLPKWSSAESQSETESYDFLKNAGDFQFNRKSISLSEENSSFHWPLRMNFVWDLNGDGLPDILPASLYEMHAYETYGYYQNQGDGNFKSFPLKFEMDVPYRLSFYNNSWTYGDYNDDGSLELLFLRIESYENVKYKFRLRAYHHDKDETFSDLTERFGFGTYVDSTKYSMPSLSFQSIDYDSDGDLDILVYDTADFLEKAGYNAYRNDAGRFTRLKIDSLGYGIFSDYDNDGYLDLIRRDSYIKNKTIPGGFFRNNGAGGFVRDPRLPRFNYGNMVDLNNDGFPDMIQNQVFRNPGNSNHWIRISIRGKQNNSFGIGAQIRVYSGGHCQLRDIRCENRSSYSDCAIAGDPYLPCFGLGPQSVVDSIIVNWPNRIIDRLYGVTADRLMTVTEGIGDASVPSKFMFSQNYPNPFNDQTSIRYAIPGNGYTPGQKTDVRIEVFDVLGRQVAILQDKPQPPGNYLVVWDGKSKNGIQSATGVYLCRIRAGKNVQTKKMLLLR